MKRKIVIVLILITALLGGLAALAVGGSSGDPLITLGYLTGTFLPGIEKQADARVDEKSAEDYETYQKKLDDSAALWAGKAGLYDGSWSYAAAFTPLTFHRGDTVLLSPGSSLLFLEGSASASAESGEMIDVSSGTSGASIEALTVNRRYLAGEDAVFSLSALSDTAVISYEGYCKVTQGTLDVLPFTDIVSTAWYYDSIQYVYDAGLFNGVSASRFAPDSGMTRAMLATVLCRLSGAAGQTGSAPLFTDVAQGAWYYDAVNWAAQNSIVNGMGGSLFAPASNVTREQLVVMLYRYAGYKGVTDQASGTLSKFPDAGKVSSWALDPMCWAVSGGIVGGRSDGTLDPSGNATRAEVSAMLERFTALFP
ncbi:hypothetical protein SDC9_97168 [bioreactor metagenome]|uniref:SLH domain-containing protein n=1 Tax=bioreactor metagenome TaxID=1076179 RepID=A0A645AB30_9ZZZZ